MRGSVTWRGRRWTFDVVALLVLVVIPLGIVTLVQLHEGNLLTAFIVLIVTWLIIAAGEAEACDDEAVS